ncbi:MAG TPA: ADP-ribosylglycohydrolase family protein, partial [Pseudonocardiaceae bacterium]|nr:ADP-ribosylglycohydrolase family protein [Pseudonocardiaceae bacterium]
GLAGAAAVAAAVSTGVGGGTVAEATGAAVMAAALAGERGYWVAAADVSERIRWAADGVARMVESGTGRVDPRAGRVDSPGGTVDTPAGRVDSRGGVVEDLVAEWIYRLVGTSVATQESVPAAFAVLASCPDDPWRACLLAASLGGDCDTIAAIVGAIAGACGGAFPDHAVRTIHEVNDLPLGQLAKDLVGLRDQR